jgi:hypothetical protein
VGCRQPSPTPSSKWFMPHHYERRSSPLRPDGGMVGFDETCREQTVNVSVCGRPKRSRTHSIVASLGWVSRHSKIRYHPRSYNKSQFGDRNSIKNAGARQPAVRDATQSENGTKFYWSVRL